MAEIDARLREEVHLLGELLGDVDVDGRARIQRRHTAGQPGVWQWLLHNYLFFRIPLFRPDAWLTHWTPRLGWLFSPQAHYLILALGAIGGILVLRDWDRFLATFLHFFNWEGMIWYGLALAVGFGTFQLSATILPANVPNLVMSGAAEGSFGIHLNYVPYLLLHTPVLG